MVVNGTLHTNLLVLDGKKKRKDGSGI